MQSPKTKQPLHPVLTVSQLTGQIKDVVEELFDNVYVVGEVSNAKAYPSGHWYFSLKDKDATLPCVCFKSANSNIKFKLEDGLMLVAQGNLSIYPPKGGYQLVASALEPVGVGEWQLAFEQLRAALEKEGLLDPARKKPIPAVPRRIGVVTSPAAAALRDILSALSRRNKNLNVVIAPTRVQGEGSAEEIAQAIRDLQAVPGIEVIIVARGGGSIEDLWSFNTEVVARAVAACPIPIVSGVGHETDTTICDLVADLRAPTPTAAAELVARGSQELLDKYQNLEQKLVFKIEQRLSKARRQLERLSPITALTRYQGRLKQYQMRVAHHKSSMERSVLHLMRNLQNRWQQRHVKLLALAPTNILNRGFAILRKLDGTVVCDASDVQPGEELQAILKTGSLYLNVAAVQESLFAMLDPRRGCVDNSGLAENSQDAEQALIDPDLPVQGLLFDIATIPQSADFFEADTRATSFNDDVIAHKPGSSESEIDDAEIEREEFGESIGSEESCEPADNDSISEFVEKCLSQTISEESFAVDEPAVVEIAKLTAAVSQDASTIAVIASNVFDPELADPAILATIFGEDLADAKSASVIFKSGANSARVELDALNEELTKDSVPPLVAIERKIDSSVVSVPQPASPASVTQKDNAYSETIGAAIGADSLDGGDGALKVNEPVLSLSDRAGENMLLALAPAANNPRPRAVKNDVLKRGAKAAAHQLNLFRSNGVED